MHTFYIFALKLESLAGESICVWKSVAYNLFILVAAEAFLSFCSYRLILVILGLQICIYVQWYHVFEGLGRSITTAPIALDKHSMERQIYQLSCSSWITDYELFDSPAAVETNV